MGVALMIRRAWAWLGRQSEDPRKVMALDSVILVLVLGLVGFLVFFVLQTNNALCSFRNDVEQRADNAQEFLATHKGDLVLGHDVRITRAQMVAQVRAQRATLKSLHGLFC